MSSAAIETDQKTLLDGPDNSVGSQAPRIVQVAKAHGVSPVTQLRETMALRFGPQSLQAKDYYENCLYDRAIPMAEKKQFAGTTGINRLNAKLTPPVLTPTRAFVGNKLLYTLLLDKVGLATTETQALVSNFRVVGQLPVLGDSGEIEAFMRDKARYPLFGKPHHGSLSEGSVRIERLEGDTVVLANGARPKLGDFASEVMKRYPGGFLLQSALTPHPELGAIAGPAVGCVRILTAHAGLRAKPVYGVWKLPAPKAMSDNFWQKGSLLALLDVANGKVQNCRRGTGLETEEITTHPESGEAIVGAHIPYWHEAVKLACAAHDLFPEFGVCGFDIAITAEGPRIIECNDNPSHTLYQLAARKGIWNEDLAPTWNAVIERQKKQLARHKAIEKGKRG